MRHKFTLEKYSSSRRYTCPNCGQSKQFTRYIDNETGRHLADYVGRCNRESNCGYHYTPKQFFADNPNLRESKRENSFHPKKVRKTPPVSKSDVMGRYGTFPTPEKGKTAEYTAHKKRNIDFIEAKVLNQSLNNYERNAFVQFLFHNFEQADVLNVLKRYFIGTWHDGRTVFWQIDRLWRIRTGQLIAYDANTGKRRKDRNPNWVHAELKREGQLTDDFALRQCFFGEHLLSLEREKPIAIVEAPKTAVFASLIFPDFVWLACGGKSNLTVEKLSRFNHLLQMRTPLANDLIVLFPDADGFAKWTELYCAAQRQGLNVTVSDLIETRATLEEKQDGLDLADYILLAGKRRIAEVNALVDRVLQDVELLAEFDEILNERIAILEVNEGLPSQTAIEIVTEPTALRSLAIQVATRKD